MPLWFMAIIICWKTCCGWRNTRRNKQTKRDRKDTKMSTQMKETKDQLIFRHTNSRKGRNISITPENSAMKHLVYSRIILAPEKTGEKVSTGSLKNVMISLSSECTIP